DVGARAGVGGAASRSGTGPAATRTSAAVARNGRGLPGPPRVARAPAAGDLRRKIPDIAEASDRREGTPWLAAGDVARAVGAARRPPPRAGPSSKEESMDVRTLSAAAGALVLAACAPSGSDTGHEGAHGDAQVPAVRSELLVSTAWLADHL